VEAGVEPAPVQKFLVPTEFHQAALVQDQDDIGPADRGETMGDDEGGPAAEEPAQGLLDQAFAFRVQGRGGLVQDQDAGILQNGPGYGHPLALAAGEGQASFPHLASQPPRQLFGELQLG